MEFTQSQEFLKETLKAVFRSYGANIEDVDENIPLTLLHEEWTDTTQIIKILIIDWSLHQRITLEKNELNFLIKCTISELTDNLKDRKRLYGNDYFDAYKRLSEYKLELFSEFCDKLRTNVKSFDQKEYLSKNN